MNGRPVLGHAARPPGHSNPKSSLDTIRQEMNKAGQKAPPLSEKLWAEFAQRFGVREPALNERAA